MQTSNVLKQARAFRENEFLVFYLLVDKLLFVILLSEFSYYLGAYQ
jgi:hypothetical protein